MMKIKHALRCVFPEKEDRTLKYSFLFTFALGLTAYGYAFFNGLFSYDNLTIFADAAEESWKLTLGRFFVPVYRAVRGGANSPVLIGFSALAWISLAVYFCCRLFGVRRRLIVAAVSAVFAVNLTVVAQISGFLYELDFNMFALLCAVLAACAWKRGGKALLLSPLFALVALGIYQSYVSVTVVLMMVCSMCALVKSYDADTKRIALKGLGGIGALLCGAALYAACLAVLSLGFGVSLDSKAANSLTGLTSAGDYLSPRTIKEVYSFTLSRWLNLRGVRVTVTAFGKSFPNVISAVCFVLLALIPTVPVYMAFKKRVKPLNLLLAAVLCALLPVGTSFLWILTGGYMQHLMMFSLWTVWLIPILLIETDGFDKSFKPRLKTAVKAVAFGCLAVIIAANVKTANAACVKKDLERSATLSVITDVSRLIHDAEGYTAGETEVVFFGNYNGGARLSGFEELYGMFGNTCNLATPAGTSVEKYYRFVLNEKFKSGYQTEEIRNSSEFAAMPCYPDRGCVGYVDGVLVVKFSS